VILLCSPLLLLKQLVSSMVCLLSAHLLLGDPALLLADQLLPPLLRSLFLQVTIVVLALVLLHNLIPPLLSLTHLVVDVKLHVIHGHLDYVVRLIDFFDLLLSLITQDLNLSLSALLSLRKLVIEGSLPLGKQFFPFLFSYLLAETSLLVPLLFRLFDLCAHFLCFFLS
jgi:hypothetical protein